MPTYDYACASCGHRLEVKQRMSENPLEICPECSEPALRKQLSSSGAFVLKGGGWFRDGYAGPSERKKESAQGASEGSSSSSSDSSGESSSSASEKASSEKASSQASE